MRFARYVLFAVFVAVAAPAAPALAQAADQIELEFWRSVERSGTSADYRAYLAQYPNGAFAPIARNRLGGTASAPVGARPPAPGSASEISLTRSQRRTVQANLTAAGYNTRGVDGIFGRGTRNAISRWQRDSGFSSTGYLSRDQYRLLSGTPAVAVRRVSNREERYWRETRARNTRSAYERYLDRYPNGFYADDARSRLGRGSSYGREDQLKRREAALGLNRREREEVELRLSRAGYYPGSINGKFGDSTRRAIRNYRRDRGLDVHPYLDRRMLNRLVRDTGYSVSSETGRRVDPDVAAGVAAGALILGGAILLAD